MTNHCLICHEPIRKLAGHETRPDTLACWVHVEGGYMCRGFRSEFDLATFDPAEPVEPAEPVSVTETPPEDYCI